MEVRGKMQSKILTGRLILFSSVLMIFSGCAAQVHIWANSDSDDAKVFSMRSPHHIHIGELVQFQITVKPDIASYVLMDFGGKLQILAKTAPGQYSFNKSFGEKWRDRRATVVVRAFRTIGKRDYVKVNKFVRKNHLKDDPPDELLGAASMQIVCYQSKVILKFSTVNNKEPDWNTGKLLIYGRGNKVSKIPLGHPGVDGFTALGTELGSNKYIIFYEPRQNQVHKTGTTKVEFTIIDPTTKKTIRQDMLIQTP